MKTFTIIFDLDDTLIPSDHKYHAPIYWCGQIIDQALGIKSPRPLDVIQKYTEIGLALVADPVYGFKTTRFPEAWVRTYRHFCEKARVSPDLVIEALIRRKAGTFQRGPFTPFDGAKKALERLRGDGHVLHLVTAGEEKFQRRKINGCGLLPMFTTTWVVEKDKKPALAAILASSEGRKPSDCVMVGDNPKSDLQPAADLGMRTMFVPSNTGVPKDAAVKPDFTIDSVAVLPLIVTTLAQE